VIRKKGLKGIAECFSRMSGCLCLCAPLARPRSPQANATRSQKFWYTLFWAITGLRSRSMNLGLVCPTLATLIWPGKCGRLLPRRWSMGLLGHRAS